MKYLLLCSLFFSCSLNAFDNTPWLLPMLEPEVTIGVETPFHSAPLALLKGSCAILEKDEVGFIAYTRPCSLSLSYERQLSNDLDADWIASSLFVQGGNALPWNDGLFDKAPLALFAGARLGSHYYIEGETYGQVFTSLGFVAPTRKRVQNVLQLGINYAFTRQHKVQIELWSLFAAGSQRALQSGVLSYTYTRENMSRWTLSGSLKRFQGRGVLPFLSLSYSISI